ncbi:hypothetical protein TRFO_06477 [Tritrichomonas foetus]|uniref:Viral A-type inclusion protein n=1 Tax=Tritrichomonas foetus TaxID=1144522 RepID=A0A1J4JYB6_9EUKA|nr:hypothetical protein TRFO_06477 [Tritrichomonas foetus]|eukprot:OHT04151.1 hypothetical protein TRFO_06477 [Tritrichomonas foetus]
MSESSSEISGALQRIHQLDAELSTSTDVSNILNDGNSNRNNNDQSILSNDQDSSDLGHGFSTPSEKVADFCIAFNKKVGVSTSTLEEVLEIVDILVSNHVSNEPYQPSENELVVKYKERIKSLKNRNIELQKKLHQTEIQNSAFQTNSDQLKYENHRLEETLSDVQQRLATAQQEIKDLKNQMNRNKNSKELLEASFANFGELINSQIDDASKYVYQRDNLMKIINKQSAALQTYEQLLTKMKEEKAQNNSSSQNYSNFDNFNPQSNYNSYNGEEYNDSESEMPSTLAIISKISNDFIDKDIKFYISDLVNDSSTPINDRIESAISYICRNSNKALQSQKESQENIDNLKTELNEMKIKCNEIVSLFDEEIQFMQRLAHSNDIQACVFYREDQNKVLPIEQSIKDELIKHCIRVNRYIEETLPQINIGEITDAFSNYENIQPTEIFNLLNANVLDKKLQLFTDRMKNNESIELKELFCLFAAQAFTNDILQNHSVELRMRYELAQREIQQLRSDLEDIKDPIRSMKKVINHLSRRENKAKKLLLNVIEFSNASNSSKSIKNSSKTNKTVENGENDNENNNSLDLLTIVKEIVQQIAENKLGHPEKLQKQLEEVISEKNKLTESLNQQLQTIESDLEKTEKIYRDKEQELIKTIDSQKVEIETEKQKNDDLNIRISEVQNQLKEMTDSFNDLRENQQAEIRNIQEMRESQIQSLTAQLEAKIDRIKDLEDSLDGLTLKFDDQKKEKKELKDRIEYLEAVNSKSASALSEKLKALREKYEIIIQQSQQQIQSIKEDNSNLKEEVHNLQTRNEEICADLTNCQINKKSIELKAKALEDRCETQRQTLTSQFDAKIRMLETQYETKVNQMNEDQTRLLNDFISHINEELDGNFDLTDYDGSLRSFLRMFTSELDSRHHSQVVYEETAADILKVQKLLKISECQELFGPVSALVKANKEMQKRVTDCEESLNEAENRSNEYCKEMRKVTNQITSLRQWESWARRLHRIINESCCTTYSSDQLRLSLEESLLATVSHRTLLSKLASLREQKKALTQMDHENLIKKGDSKRPTWLSIIAISAFIRRMQKISGCMPIESQGSSASSLVLSTGAVETPKRKKSRAVHGMTDKPQKKPPALFKNI